jgi:flagellar basal-body rod protein FlgB
MQVSALSDFTMRSLQVAMKGISARRQAFQDNIANSETPGFRAQTVSFEGSLADAMRDGRPEGMRISTVRSTAATNANGNNVSVDEEFVALSENSLRGQLVTEALNSKYRLLRSAIQETRP